MVIRRHIGQSGWSGWIVSNFTQVRNLCKKKFQKCIIKAASHHTTRTPGHGPRVFLASDLHGRRLTRRETPIGAVRTFVICAQMPIFSFVFPSLIQIFILYTEIQIFSRSVTPSQGAFCTPFCTPPPVLPKAGGKNIF